MTKIRNEQEQIYLKHTVYDNKIKKKPFHGFKL